MKVKSKKDFLEVGFLEGHGWVSFINPTSMVEKKLRDSHDIVDFLQADCRLSQYLRFYRLIFISFLALKIPPEDLECSVARWV